jgi:DNA polymerase elongation subunit (family B)
LVVELDKKLKLIDLAITLAYAAKVNFADVFSPVRTWDVIIFNYLYIQKIVIPQRKVQKKEGHYQGGYVKDPLVGKHHWCCSFDINSLYPMLMVQYNMSPETISKQYVDLPFEQLLEKNVNNKMFDQLKVQKYAITANGACFTKEKKGVLPTLAQYYYDQRVQIKRQMILEKQRLSKLEENNDFSQHQQINNLIASLNNQQMAYKILINSLYGACGSPYFRYFDTRIAEGITLTGQLTIRSIANALNGYFQKIMGDTRDRVVLVDTDSVVLTLEDIVQKAFQKKTPSTEKIIDFLDAISNQTIQPLLKKEFDLLSSFMNAYEQKMQMKRENLIDVMISRGKKSYAMSVYNSEGVQYKEPKLKIMGLQMIKTSTPAVMRDKLKEGLVVILRQTEQQGQEFVKLVEEQIKTYQVEEISFPRTATNVQKFADSTKIYKKGTPIHIRGALLYNHYLKQMNLIHKYRLIDNQMKIKFVYLKTPNPINENCIGYIDQLPNEFGLHSFIDYRMMFEKAFLEPMKDLMEVIGWQVYPVPSLLAFCG